MKRKEKIVGDIKIVKDFSDKGHSGENKTVEIENETFYVKCRYYYGDGHKTLIAIEEVVTLENGNQIFLLDGHKSLTLQLVEALESGEDYDLNEDDEDDYDYNDYNYIDNY